MRSWGWLMRKFSRDRSVWAPQYLSAGTWTSPKASLSVLVLAAILKDVAWRFRWNCRGCFDLVVVERRLDCEDVDVREAEVEGADNEEAAHNDE